MHSICSILIVPLLLFFRGLFVPESVSDVCRAMPQIQWEAGNITHAWDLKERREMSHFKQFTLVHSMYSKRSIVVGEHYQLPLEWGKEKKVDSSLKHRFQYLYASLHHSPYNRYGKARERKLLKKFMALFLEIKYVFSIALGDWWERCSWNQPPYVENCLQGFLFPVFVYQKLAWSSR